MLKESNKNKEINKNYDIDKILKDCQKAISYNFKNEEYLLEAINRLVSDSGN